MQIIFKGSFTVALDAILDYISEDSINQAILFNSGLHKKIKEIPLMPYKSRKSIHYGDDDIRDMIFKGYTITYLVEKEQIIILGILKYKKTF